MLFFSKRRKNFVSCYNIIACFCFFLFSDIVVKHTTVLYSVLRCQQINWKLKIFIAAMSIHKQSIVARQTTDSKVQEHFTELQPLFHIMAKKNNNYLLKDVVPGSVA